MVDAADRVNWSRRALNSAHLAVLARVERSVPFWPSERIERLQRHRLRAIIRHGYETVPYYRRVMDERGLRPGDFETADDLAKLSLLDSATVRLRPEQFVSTRVGTRSALALYSSGSPTHVRKLIYWDRAAALRRLAHHERDRVVLGRLVGKGVGQRQLIIGDQAAPPALLRELWDANLLLTQRVVERHRLPSDLPFEAAARRINAIRPDVVFSPSGSYADRFFRFLADRRLAVPPSVWVYGGDMLSPGGRELIESTGCVVYSTYQAVETGRLGFECERHEGFHLNVDLCPVRIVDEVSRDVPAGESGEVVVSNLVNRGTVLLNYRLDDRGALAAVPCPCGRSLPLLKRLEGRTSELVALADGRVISSLELEGRFRQELRPTLQVQIVHPAPGHVRWRIVPFAGAGREALRRGLVERGPEVLGQGTRVEVEFVADIPRDPSGKFTRVVAAGVASPVDPSGSDEEP